MKQPLACILLLLLLSSCKDKTVDDSMKTCSGDKCTIIKGRFTTRENEGIPNVTVEIRSETQRGLGSTLTRKLAEGKTDSNGNYSFSFGLNTSEYDGKAHFKMSYKYDQSKYLPTNIPFSEVEQYLRINTRLSEPVTYDMYLPSVRKIKVRLENFVKVQAGDYFKVFTQISYGENNADGENGRKSTSYDFIASDSTAEREMYVMGDDTTVIQIYKRKNGIYTFQDTVIYTPMTGEQLRLTFIY